MSRFTCLRHRDSVAVALLCVVLFTSIIHSFEKREKKRLQEKHDELKSTAEELQEDVKDAKKAVVANKFALAAAKAKNSFKGSATRKNQVPSGRPPTNVNVQSNSPNEFTTVLRS